MTQRDSTLSVLVTGVGAIIGQGIIGGLRRARRAVRIVGLDRSDRSPGPFLCDAFHRKPDCAEDHAEYPSFWRRLLKQERIDLVLPGLEVDMYFVDAHLNLFEDLGVAVAVNRPELVTLCTDKWQLGEALAATGLPRIPSSLARSWAEAVGELGPPPLLLKPRRGNGSRGIVKLDDERDFDYWRSKAGDNWMLQKIVGDDANEFTVGVFGFGDGESVKPLVMRRRLSVAGNTVEAQIACDGPVLEASWKLTRHFRPLGPTNYQFRKDGDTPYLLEINPRFSSSNSLRTAFGFNEAQMAVDFFLFGERPREPVIENGIAWRYSEDFVRHDRRPV
jgi:carbamoyl-phosphate synthase large subunit